MLTPSPRARKRANAGEPGTEETDNDSLPSFVSLSFSLPLLFRGFSRFKASHPSLANQMHVHRSIPCCMLVSSFHRHGNGRMAAAAPVSISSKYAPTPYAPHRRSPPSLLFGNKAPLQPFSSLMYLSPVFHDVPTSCFL